MDVITSAHHGFINYENQLDPIALLFETYPSIGIIEIDFVHTNNNFISSHDYSEENISKGSKLEQWVDSIMTHNKMLWIDIKDDNLSMISDQFSLFDVQAFYQCLQSLEAKYSNLKRHLLIGCQYTNTYNRLVANNIGYNIVHDQPQYMSYVLYDIFPLCMIKSWIHKWILEDLQGTTGTVCLDRTFFSYTNEINEFISKLHHQTIIVYSYNLNETNLPSVPGKNIILQFNYEL